MEKATKERPITVEEANRILKMIDKLKFGKWYRVKNDKQKEQLKQLFEADLLPECEFNDTMTRFRRVFIFSPDTGSRFHEVKFTYYIA